MKMIRMLSVLAAGGVIGSGVAQAEEYDTRTEEQRLADEQAEAAARADLEAMASGWGYVAPPAEALEEVSDFEEDTFSTEAFGFGGRFLSPIKVRDCWYFVSSEQHSRGGREYLTVRRLQTPRCEAQIIAFLDAFSYWNSQGSFQVIAKEDSLVIAYQVDESLSAPYSHLRIYNLSVDTLQNVRTVSSKIESWGRGVDATHLSFEGHRLIVRGTTRGPLKNLPMDGGFPGSYYTLTFEHFLDRDESPSVMYSAEPPSGPITTPEEISTTYYPPIEGDFIPPFQMNNCWYFVSARSIKDRFSPRLLNIERLPVNGCEGKITYLGNSYITSPVLVAKKGNSAIAIAHTVKTMPLFVDSPIYVQLYEISPETLENERLFNNLLGSTSGNVFASRAYFLGHELIVKGIKTGPIATWPAESGSGSNYAAIFGHFLESYQPPTVVAW